MRTVVAFLVTLLLLIAGGVTADALVTDRAERTAAEELAAQLGGDADVRFGPWPVTLWLLGGRMPEVSVVLVDVPAGEVRLQRVAVELARVRVDAGLTLAGLGSGPETVTLRADEGRLDAELDEAAVSQLVGAPVRLGEGQATIETDRGAFDAVAGVEDDEVVLRPVGDVPDGAEPARFDPPPLPGDARLTRVQLHAGVARLTAEVRQLGT